jgi:hypothetical protein
VPEHEWNKPANAVYPQFRSNKVVVAIRAHRTCNSKSLPVRLTLYLTPAAIRTTMALDPKQYAAQLSISFRRLSKKSVRR